MDDDPEDSSPRGVLARNLAKLMQASKGARRDLSSPQRIEGLTGFSKSQVDRIRGAKMGATVDTLGDLAAVFGLHPWQLLVPTLDAWQDAGRRLCVATPVDSTPAQSVNLKRAHAVLRELTDEERASLFAAIQAQPILDHEVEERIPATRAKPATNADKLIQRAVDRLKGSQKSQKRRA